MAELADALDSGSSSRKGVEVQVLSSAPIKSIGYRDSDALHRRAFSRWCDYSVTNFEFRSVDPSFGVTVSVTPGVAGATRTRGFEARVKWTVEGREDAVEGGSGGDLRLVVAPAGFFVLGSATTDVLIDRKSVV